MEEIKEKKRTWNLPKIFPFKAPGKEVFWVWVLYQTVKGTITTTFIWIPLFYIWWYQ